MNNLEAWSTGRIRMEIIGSTIPVFAAVEILRISRLVYCIGRADSDDPGLANYFPVLLSSIEVYPAVSLVADPLADLGKRVAEAFFAQVAETVEAARKLAAGEPPFDNPARPKLPPS